MDRDDEHITRSVKVMKKSGKLWIALGGVALGVILLLFGGELGERFSGHTSEEASPTSDPDGQARLSMEDYRLALEARICHICARVEGAGQVYAVVNLAGGYEYVYAADVKTTTGGVSNQHIVIGSGNDERVVYLTQRVPEILGIGVVCGGGNDPRVQNEVTRLLSAAFGVGSNKIYVTGGG
jgi:hypothetical protein